MHRLAQHTVETEEHEGQPTERLGSGDQRSGGGEEQKPGPEPIPLDKRSVAKQFTRMNGHRQAGGHFSSEADVPDSKGSDGLLGSRRTFAEPPKNH